MKNNHRFLNLVLLSAMMPVLLTACGPEEKFVAPEIEPPADLVPGYVPEGFELVKGYQIEPGSFDGSRFVADAENCKQDTRRICGLELLGSFFDLKSPAGNDIQGIHYQDGDSLLLITKSYYSGGSMDLWRAAYEAPGEETREGDFDCLPFAIARRFPPLPLRSAGIQEVRTVVGTQVTVLDGPLGLITVFVRRDYLLTVESGISLEENLRIIASLLQN